MPQVQTPGALASERQAPFLNWALLCLSPNWAVQPQASFFCSQAAELARSSQFGNCRIWLVIGQTLREGEKQATVPQPQSSASGDSVASFTVKKTYAPSQSSTRQVPVVSDSQETESEM